MGGSDGQATLASFGELRRLAIAFCCENEDTHRRVILSQEPSKPLCPTNRTSRIGIAGVGCDPPWRQPRPLAYRVRCWRQPSQNPARLAVKRIGIRDGTIPFEKGWNTWPRPSHRVGSGIRHPTRRPSVPSLHCPALLWIDEYPRQVCQEHQPHGGLFVEQVSQQRSDRRSLTDNRYTYGHGFAMLFLSQVLGEEGYLDRRQELVEALKNAVSFCGQAQTPSGGWGYLSAKDANDYDEGSTTITQVQGLRGCRNAVSRFRSISLKQLSDISIRAKMPTGVSATLASRWGLLGSHYCSVAGFPLQCRRLRWEACSRNADLLQTEVTRCQ